MCLSTLASFARSCAVNRCHGGSDFGIGVERGNLVSCKGLETRFDHWMIVNWVQAWSRRVGALFVLLRSSATYMWGDIFFGRKSICHGGAGALTKKEGKGMVKEGCCCSYNRHIYKENE